MKRLVLFSFAIGLGGCVGVPEIDQTGSSLIQDHAYTQARPSRNQFTRTDPRQLVRLNEQLTPAAVMPNPDDPGNPQSGDPKPGPPDPGLPNPDDNGPSNPHDPEPDPPDPGHP